MVVQLRLSPRMFIVLGSWKCTHELLYKFHDEYEPFPLAWLRPLPRPFFGGMLFLSNAHCAKLRRQSSFQEKRQLVGRVRSPAYRRIPRQ